MEIARTATEAKHPGELLRDVVLPALALSVSQAARDLMVTRQTLHRILAGRAAITPDMAVRIEKLCGVSSGFWLDLQLAYEIERASGMNKHLLPLIPSRSLPANVLESMGISDG